MGTAFTLSGPIPQVLTNLQVNRFAEYLPQRNRQHSLIKNFFDNAPQTGYFEQQLPRVFEMPLEMAREAVALIDTV